MTRPGFAIPIFDIVPPKIRTAVERTQESIHSTQRFTGIVGGLYQKKTEECCLVPRGRLKESVFPLGIRGTARDRIEMHQTEMHEFIGVGIMLGRN